MSDKEIYAALLGIGCCKACCLRHLGEKTPSLYEDLKSAHIKYNTEIDVTKPTSSSQLKKEINENTNMEPGDTEVQDNKSNGETEMNCNAVSEAKKNAEEDEESEGPPRKRCKWEICPCCLGLLQEETWSEALEKVKKAMESKGYDSKEFACGLSSPTSVLLREKSIAAYVESKFPGLYDSGRYITSLKEAWKWSFGPKLAQAVNKELSSGAYCALMITLNMEYANDNEELQTLQKMSPDFFTKRQRNARAYRAEQLYFTRASVSEVLQQLPVAALKEHFGVPPPLSSASCRCISVQCNHAPVYFAGRYIKLSRELSQTPWVVDGRRLMENSIQDVLFAPIAKLYKIPLEDVERRMKLMSAGREDVDVRCLGTGRPFAIELSDPQQASPSIDTLQQLCKEMTKTGILRVDQMSMVDRQDLAHLKHGEETKTKTYSALCVKITNSHKIDTEDTKDKNETEKIEITDKEIERMCNFTNSDEDTCRVLLQQKTPLRVLHRRPLLTRQRKLLDMSAVKVADNPNYFILTLKTEAGTYVKEFVHGDFGRTKPSLRDILDGAEVDILALDVTAVDLDWPKER